MNEKYKKMSSDDTGPNTADSSAVSTAQFDRRSLLIGAGIAAGAAVAYPVVRRLAAQPCPVFLARGQRYDGPLAKTIRDGLESVGFDSAWIHGRRVLLKPNLVEPDRSVPHMTTHPAVVVAAAQVFLDWGAKVTVGEAPGHVRDTEMALVESHMDDALREAKVDFADLNYEEPCRIVNAGGVSRIQDFSFPRSVAEADLIVSMPKLKTHHWAGFTASMKNLYGTLPGIVYGWPKNVLHYAGIPQTIVDINASLPKVIGIVDGITCMEGDGPIMGTAKSMGLLGIGLTTTSLDATLGRVMGFDPAKVPYLQLAAGQLGPIDERNIIERGDLWRDLAEPFAVLDQPHLRKMLVT